MSTSGVRRVGRYMVDLDRRRLLADGEAIELGWRQFEALRLLVEADGRVVERDEFFRKVWRNIAVDESNLTKCIAQLRKTLNNGGTEDYLETVPRVGYRLAAAVVPTGCEEVVAAVEPRRRSWAWIVAAVATAVLLGSLAWYANSKRQQLARAEAAHEEGKRLRRERNPDALGAAIESYRKAIGLNPGNAEYWGSLAEALTKVPNSPDPKLAIETAERGLAIDPRCGGCNAVLGFALFSRFQEWERAERHLTTAIGMNPKDYGSRGYYSMLLASQGRLKESLRTINEGLAIDPYFSTLHAIKAGVCYFLGRYEEAATAAERAVSFGMEQKAAWYWRVYSSLLAGKHADAIDAAVKSGGPHYPRDLDLVFRAGGIQAATRRVLETSRIGWVRAHWRMVLDDPTGALDELDASRQAREFDLMYIAVDPMFKPLRTEPRFCRIVGEMKLRLDGCS
jgi:DNA-binding winged helix-turn-helix (wHTH) protein